MKKFLTILLIAVLAVASVFTFTACDNGSKTDGKTGLLYKKNRDGEYVIYKYVDDGRTSTKLDIADEIKDIEAELNNGTKLVIRKGAFADNNTIEELVIPASVTEVEAGALEKMKKLSTLSVAFVGKTVLSDAYYAESKKEDGKSVDAERTIAHYFSEQAYDEGVSVTVNYGAGSKTVYMPATLTKVVVNPVDNYSIPMYAFNGTYNILDIELGEKVDAIGTFAFANSRIQSIVIPANVKTIYESAFASSALLKSVSYAGSDLVIKAEAFSGCAKFETFNSTQKYTLNCDKVASIGRGAFDFGNDKEYTTSSVATSIDLELAFGEQDYK